MRVSNSTLQQSLLLELQRTQSSFADAQSRVATGKIGTDLSDFGSKAELVAAGRLAHARTEQRISLANEVSNRLDTQAIVLKGATDVADTLNQEIFTAIGTNFGGGIQAALNSAFSQVLGAFNTEQSGQYLFAGTRSDTPPVSIQTIDDLASAASVDDIFANNDVKPSVDLGDGPVETGQLASDAAKPIFGVIKSIKDYIVANGDFSSPLTDAQTAFLKSQLPALSTASAALVSADAANGAATKTLETTRAKQDDVRVALGDFVSSVEDADIVEASTKLQQSQLAYEAAAQTLAKLNQLSLLDFLR